MPSALLPRTAPGLCCKSLLVIQAADPPADPLDLAEA
jgi:hypothetical protein